MKPAIEHIDVKVEELKQALERSRQAPLEDPDYRKLEAAVNTLDYLTELVADKDTTIRQLRQRRMKTGRGRAIRNPDMDATDPRRLKARAKSTLRTRS